MTKTLKTRMAVMEEQINHIKDELVNHSVDQKEDFREVKHQLQCISENMETRLEKLGNNLDNKYANKWVEKVAIGALGTVIATVVGGVIVLI